MCGQYANKSSLIKILRDLTLSTTPNQNSDTYFNQFLQISGEQKGRKEQLDQEIKKTEIIQLKNTLRKLNEQEKLSITEEIKQKKS